MNEALNLIVLQTFCFTTALCLALLLGLSRIHIRQVNRSYEITRWLLFTAMMLFAIHYLLQMVFGFRAQGEDVGAIINILFYTPVAYLLSYSTARLVCPIGYLKPYILLAAVSFIAVSGVFVLGWFIYRSLHMHHALYVMEAIFFVTMLVFIILPINKIKQRRRLLESETGSDMEYFNAYMQTGTTLLFCFGAMVPIVIFSTKLLALIAPLYIIVLFFYILSFVALGYNLTPLSDAIDDASQGEPLVLLEKKEKMSSDSISRIETLIDKWIATRGFSDPTLNINSLARRLGVDKRLLAQYLAEKEGLTFRVWLSNLRIGEVKRLLIEHPEYSNEAIALECGYSSRTWMQQRFKAVTGMTPNEWKENN